MLRQIALLCPELFSNGKKALCVSVFVWDERLLAKSWSLAAFCQSQYAVRANEKEFPEGLFPSAEFPKGFVFAKHICLYTKSPKPADESEKQRA